LSAVNVGARVRRVAALRSGYDVAVASGPDAEIPADADQLEQLLINLVQNAVEAAQETRGLVRARWKLDGDRLEILIEDEGPGLSDTKNLFVPFFTTKSGGSGIGLALGRQIAEAHGGSLDLENRVGATGCRATLRLPIRRGSRIGEPEPRAAESGRARDWRRRTGER